MVGGAGFQASCVKIGNTLVLLRESCQARNSDLQIHDSSSREKRHSAVALIVIVPVMDDLKDKTWEDDLGEWEHIRFEPANEENGITELPDDEIRRLWYGKLNAEEESK